MELRHLRYFIAIAEEQSFTRAAERLWVAQPALSTQIRRLEAELGVQLFERHTRGVDLTPAGELFLERARVALAAVHVASATGRDLEAGVTGSVRLGVASEARWRPTSELLRRFARERPGVALALTEGRGGALWRDLRDGRLDAVVAPAGHGSPDLRSLELGAETWVALIGAGHPLVGAGALAARDLDGERIAVTGHRDGTGFDRAVAELLDELLVTAELVPGPPALALHAAIAEDALVALTTAPDALPPGVIARRLDPHRSLPFQLLWRDDAKSPALDELITVAAGIEPRVSGPLLAAVA
jgi:DNA-binding transcriptional LysR family regulator